MIDAFHDFERLALDMAFVCIFGMDHISRHETFCTFAQAIINEFFHQRQAGYKPVA